MSFTSDPYFTVLAHDKFRGATLSPQADEEFFATGETHVAHLLHRLVPLRPESILEFGCGPGRLAIPFAKRAKTTAVDLDPEMLALARANAERHGAHGIRFQTPDELRRSDERFNLVNAFLVLQRMPQDEGLEILRLLISRIAGVGVFQLPVHRELDLVRRAVNVVRHKPPYIYSLHDVLAVVGECSVVPERWGDLDVVTLFVHRAAPEPEQTIEEAQEELPRDFIDVRTLIAERSIEQLNETAEQYFASRTDWTGFLAKPFNAIDDAPKILTNVGVVLPGLRLFPGARVLEFGAGTGWLSHRLAQLGCETTLLDVSPTALRIARELFEKHPLFGESAKPRFLVYDGRHIDLPDASIDRIVCFDAFHHSPNPEDVIREFARVLAPGGIAGFVEPGPEHSRTAQSQSEMRLYNVVENDIHIHALWDAARSAGFEDLRLAAFTGAPLYMSLDKYEELLDGGAALSHFAQTSRAFLHNCRTFFLYKGNADAIDSRIREGLSCAIEILEQSGRQLRVRVTNDGRAVWLPSDAGIGAVYLAAHLLTVDGLPLVNDFHWQKLPRALQPYESIEISFELPPPPDAGEYVAELDCVADKVSWFAEVKPTAVRVHLS